MHKALYVVEGVLQLLIGLGAVASGAVLVISPDGHILSMTPDMLRASPFRDFLIPGLILFAVNGVGNVVSGILSFRRHRYAPFAGMVFGLGLMIWIFAQVNMIGGGHWLQVLYFFLGGIELVLAILMRETKKV